VATPRDDETNELLRRFRDTRERAVRNRVVEAHRGLAASLAREFDRTSEPFEDRFQVALLGLVKAAERFDPDYGTPFVAFAAVTVRGELRRHFRDHGWAVRVPRRLQELRYEIRAATDALTLRNHCSPTPADVASHLGVAVDDVIDALCADQNYRSRSLDDQGGSDDRASLAERTGAVDSGYEDVESTEAFRGLVARCPPRLQRVLQLRYVDGKKQTEIASELGISQVHVSRLLAQAHGILRSVIDEPSTAPAGGDRRVGTGPTYVGGRVG
jgi:RNA polymerase sigma-B factor